jgi:hypothetical protein
MIQTREKSKKGENEKTGKPQMGPALGLASRVHQGVSELLEY